MFFIVLVILGCLVFVMILFHQTTKQNEILKKNNTVLRTMLFEIQKNPHKVDSIITDYSIYIDKNEKIDRMFLRR